MPLIKKGIKEILQGKDENWAGADGNAIFNGLKQTGEAWLGAVANNAIGVAQTSSLMLVRLPRRIITMLISETLKRKEEVFTSTECTRTWLKLGGMVSQTELPL